jgi:hypothetical protein
MPRLPGTQKISPTIGNPSANGHSRTARQLTSLCLDQPKLLAVLRGVRSGDFGVRLPLEWTGVSGDIPEVFNDIVELNERLSREFERISRAVGREGKTEQRASLGGVSGEWSTSLDSINLLIADLTQSHARMRAQLTDLTYMAPDRDGS